MRITSEKSYTLYQQEAFPIISSSITPPYIATLSSSTTKPSSPPKPYYSKTTPPLTPPVVTIILPSAAFMARFGPLVFLAQLATLPQNSGQILPLFDGTIEITTRKHIDKIVDSIDVEEVDEDDAKMHLIAQSFLGEVNKWFHALRATCVANPQ